MNDREKARSDAFERIEGFLETRISNFTAGGKAVTAYADLQQVNQDIAKYAAQQSTGGGQRTSGTTAKSVLADGLSLDLSAMSTTAQDIEEDEPGFASQFQLPDANNYGDLLTAAKTFLQNATPADVKAKFIAYEMEPEFLDDLAADIEAFENAKDDQGGGLSDQVTATKALALAIAKGMRARKTLNAAVRNKYKRDAVTLRAWESASHIERPPRRKKDTTDGTQPTK